MKKLIGTLAMAALIASAAFAEITFGSWGRAMWNVSNSYDGEDDTVIAGMRQNWGGASPRTALSVHGSDEEGHIGFNLDIFGDGEGLSIGDNAQLWVKPIDQIQIAIGKMDWNVLRRDACTPLWGWQRIGVVGATGQEGFLAEDSDRNGLNLFIRPIEGLTIVAAVDTPYEEKGGDKLVDNLGRKGYIGAAYEIDGIGIVQVSANNAYWGKGTNVDGEEVDPILINPVFILTAVDGLYAGIGAKIYTENMGKGNAEINLYGCLSMIENMNIYLIAGVNINSANENPEEPEKDGNVGFMVDAAVDYTFGDNIKVFAELGFASGIWMAGSDADNKECFSFGIGIQKGYSNGCFGIAFEGATNAYGAYDYKEADTFAWTVPVKIEVSF